MNDRFIDGNLIILYALSKSSSTQEGSPEYILNRVRLCLDIHGIIIRSKPDKNRTVVYTVTDLKSIGYIKQELVKRGIGEDKMVFDTTSKNVRQTCDSVIRFVKDRVNPPKIYFVGSAWQRKSFESTVSIKLKEYAVQFEGALDSRPVVEIDRENAADSPKRGIQFYKKQAKDKAANLLLNLLFQNKREVSKR
ncbi:MAG: hypothetical protein WA395_05795 [Nitrososphaeraceae archaeon]